MPNNRNIIIADILKGTKRTDDEWARLLNIKASTAKSYRLQGERMLARRNVPSPSPSESKSGAADGSLVEEVSVPRSRLERLEAAADHAAQAIESAAKLTRDRMATAGTADIGSLRELAALLSSSLKELRAARSEDSAAVPHIDALSAGQPTLLREMLTETMAQVERLSHASVPE